LPAGYRRVFGLSSLIQSSVIARAMHCLFENGHMNVDRNVAVQVTSPRARLSYAAIFANVRPTASRRAPTPTLPRKRERGPAASGASRADHLECSWSLLRRSPPPTMVRSVLPLPLAGEVYSSVVRIMGGGTLRSESCSTSRVGCCRSPPARVSERSPHERRAISGGHRYQSTRISHAHAD
jgi:hypothetical protein